MSRAPFVPEVAYLAPAPRRGPPVAGPFATERDAERALASYRGDR